MLIKGLYDPASARPRSNVMIVNRNPSSSTESVILNAVKDLHRPEDEDLSLCPE
jgi:hypothetical protein